MKLLITGVAGFIGFHVARYLINSGYEVTGIDDLNEYYEKTLKKSRLKILNGKNFNFKKINISNKVKVDEIFENIKPDIVIHLAAQAGVRHSILKPYDYINSNILGFQNIIENCRHYNIKHFIYASSSSVYGLNNQIPFSENDKTENPANLYGATKKSNEIVAFSYSHLYALPTTGLRFFTVYGPWGRPDMAYFKFTKNIIEGKKINIYGNGNMYRDFTYIDDVVSAISKLINIIPSAKNKNIVKSVPADIFNIGNNKPELLEDFVKIIEDTLKIKSYKNYMSIQKGDVYKTYADINKIQKLINYKPVIRISEGIPLFIDWYKNFYKINNS